MKCQICSAEVPASAAFCPDCGAKLSGAEGAKAAAARSAEPAPARKDIPEETLWEGSYSPKAMLGSLILCGLISVVLIVAALLFAPTGIISAVLIGAMIIVWLAAALQFAKNRLGKHYRLTNQMFYHREGLLTRTTDRVELIEIHDVKWEQNLIQRLVNVGTITITSADKSHGNLPLSGIEDVEAVASKIDKARRAEQVRRGRRIEFTGMENQS